MIDVLVKLLLHFGAHWDGSTKRSVVCIVFGNNEVTLGHAQAEWKSICIYLMIPAPRIVRSGLTDRLQAAGSSARNGNPRSMGHMQAQCLGFACTPPKPHARGV